MIRHTTDRGTIHEARAEDVYPLLDEGSVELVISDGPYGMLKAQWDRMRVSDLPAWYRPHIEAWGRVCAPSASVYVWGTAESWAAVHPELLSAGWTFRGLIVWDKGIASLAGRLDTKAARMWPDVTEVCGLYQRQPDLCAYLRREREQRGISSRDLASAVVGTPSGAVWNWEYGNSHMTEDNWVSLWRALNASGPHMVLPGCPKWSLQMHQTVTQAAEDDIRAEYQALRPPFSLPVGATNVWAHPIVAGSARLQGKGGALHPCEKPLSFARRMVLASSRPGDFVLEPFGGTCRVAVACEEMTPAEARRYACIEPNEDGVDYLAPVIEQIDAARRQGHLFGGIQ